MEQIIYVIDKILWVGLGYFFYKSVSRFLEPRKNIVCRYVGGFIGYFVCSMVVFPREIFNTIFNIPLFLLMLLIGFEQRLLVKVSTVLLLFPVIMAVNFLTMDIGGNIWMKFFRDSDMANEAISTVGFFISMLFWYWFQKRMDKSVGEMFNTLDNRSWYLLDTICLASLTGVISFLFFTPQESYKVWLGMLACLVTNLAAIRLVFYLAENIRGKLEQKNTKLQQDYYEELESGQRELRKFRHDMNNHFGVLAELMENGKETEASAYFRRMSGELRAKGRSFCKNSVVNAVLNSKYNRAAAQDIDCFFHINIDDLLFIDPMDICTLFSNTLDNAIEACMKVEKEKRSLSVKARCTENGYFSYEIQNTIYRQIQIENGKYKTWKKEKRSHGIGLENVKDVVKKYSGTMDISHDADSFCVTVLIAEGTGLNG